MNVSDSGKSGKRAIAIGIDLGTTYSLLSYLDPAGRPISLPSSSGDLLTPSAVIVDEDEIVVGREAVKASAYNPECYAEWFSSGTWGVWQFSARFTVTTCPPEILSALVLERLRLDAEKRLGPVEPGGDHGPSLLRRDASQSDPRRGQASRLERSRHHQRAPRPPPWRADGSVGFLGCEGPHASRASGCSCTILAGARSMLPLLEITPDKFRTLATDGDVRLGGKDFDQAIVDHIAECFLSEHGLDPRSDPCDMAQLWRDAQDVKHALSEHTKDDDRVFSCGDSHEVGHYSARVFSADGALAAAHGRDFDTRRSAGGAHMG